MPTPAPNGFIDTNVLLCLQSADTAKANRAGAIVRKGGSINVQVLNEMAGVARSKLAMPWTEITARLELTHSLC